MNTPKRCTMCFTAGCSSNNKTCAVKALRDEVYDKEDPQLTTKERTNRITELVNCSSIFTEQEYVVACKYRSIMEYMPQQFVKYCEQKGISMPALADAKPSARKYGSETSTPAESPAAKYFSTPTTPVDAAKETTVKFTNPYVTPKKEPIPPAAPAALSDMQQMNLMFSKMMAKQDKMGKQLKSAMKDAKNARKEAFVAKQLAQSAANMEVDSEEDECGEETSDDESDDESEDEYETVESKVEPASGILNAAFNSIMGSAKPTEMAEELAASKAREADMAAKLEMMQKLVMANISSAPNVQPAKVKKNKKNSK